jgi:cyclopropane fatty-acyl-phospholipid synthase-like methyltransferase
MLSNQLITTVFAALTLFIFVKCTHADSTSTDTLIEELNTPAVDSTLPDLETNRMAWQKPNLLLDKLGDLSNRVMADIGSGTGYFTFRLAMRAKKVIAVDIDPQMLELVEEFKKNLDQNVSAKVETRLATTSDPELLPDEVDDIIIINTIEYIDRLPAYLKLLHKRIKDGGRVIIVDFKTKRIPAEILTTEGPRITILAVEDMLDAAGFSDISTDDMSLNYQYIIIAKK